MLIPEGSVHYKGPSPLLHWLGQLSHSAPEGKSIVNKQSYIVLDKQQRVYEECIALTYSSFFCSSLQCSKAFTTNQEHLKSSISVPIWVHKRTLSRNPFTQTELEVVFLIFLSIIYLVSACIYYGLILYIQHTLTHLTNCLGITKAIQIIILHKEKKRTIKRRCR